MTWKIGLSDIMKTMRGMALLFATLVLVSGCSDREADARRAKEEADAKARAEAARKEMEALPKTFKTPDYFRKAEPEEPPPPKSDEPKS